MASQLKLYELADWLSKALDELTDSPDIPPEAIRDTLEGIEMGFDEKVLSVAAYARNLELEHDAVETAYKIIAARKKALATKVEWLKSYLLWAMVKTGKKGLKRPNLTVEIKNNPPLVNITDIHKIPYKLIDYEVVMKPDKNEIKAQLKAGKLIPGAELITDSKRIEIK